MLDHQLSKICTFRWRGHLLSAAVATNAPEIDMGDQDLTDLIIDLYPSLGWADYAVLKKRIESEPQLSQSLDHEKLARHFGFAFNDRSEQIRQKFLDCSPLFIEWARTKKASQQDLAPLAALGNLENFNPILEKMVAANLSRSEGKQVLDWLVDLYLMGYDLGELTVDDCKKWQTNIFRLRYPNTHSEDAKEAEKIWPTYCQHSRHRNGDRLEQALRIKFTDLDDLAGKLSTLLANLGKQCK